MKVQQAVSQEEEQEMRVRMRQAQRKMKGVKLQYTDSGRVYFDDVAGVAGAKVGRLAPWQLSRASVAACVLLPWCMSARSVASKGAGLSGQLCACTSSMRVGCIHVGS
jgi:hypothetical protein